MADIFKDGDILYAKPLNDLANEVADSSNKIEEAVTEVDAVNARLGGIRTIDDGTNRIQEFDSAGKLIAEYDETGKKIFYAGVKASTAETDKIVNSDGTQMVPETNPNYLGTEVDQNGMLLWGTLASTGQKIYLARKLRNDAGLWRGNASIMGDSITANGYNNGAFEGRSWHMWASMSLLGQFFIEGVFATGGYTSSQIRSIWLPQAIAKGSEFCVVMAGRNDVNQGFDIDNVTIPNMTYIYNQLMINGIWPVLCTMSAHGNSTDDTKRKAEHKINNWIRAMARKHGLPLVDLHKETVNPKTGDWLPGIAADVSHPTYIGARIMGKVLADTLAKWVSPALPTMAEEQIAVGLTNNIMPNPLFYSHSDATIPDGWTKSGAGVSEMLAETSDGKGDILHLTGSARFLRYIDVTPGKKYGFGVFIKSVGDDSTMLKSAYVKPVPDDSGSVYSAGLVGFAGQIDNWSYVYNEFVVPTGVTKITVALAASGGETWFRQIGIFELPEVKQ